MKRRRGLCSISTLLLLGVGVGHQCCQGLEMSWEGVARRGISGAVLSRNMGAARWVDRLLLNGVETSLPTDEYEATLRQFGVTFLPDTGASPALQEQAESGTKNPSDDYNARLKNVIALWKAGRAHDAAQAVAELVKTDPGRWEGYAIAGVIEEGVNNDAAAKIVYERGLSLAPEADKPRLREAIQHLESKSNVMAVCQGDRPAVAPACAAPPKLLQAVSSTNHDLVGKHQSEGSVRLKVIVGNDGSTRDCRVIKSSAPDLDSAAVSAVTQWKFKPATYQGKPVAVEIELEVAVWFDANITPALPNTQVAGPAAGKQVTETPPK